MCDRGGGRSALADKAKLALERNISGVQRKKQMTRMSDGRGNNKKQKTERKDKGKARLTCRMNSWKGKRRDKRKRNRIEKD